MNTAEIYACLKSNPQTKSCIEDVVPVDYLPEKSGIKYNEAGVGYLVVNLDPSYMSGSHWIAICLKTGPGSINEYFDSYGLEPPQKIKQYLGANYIRQTRQLQGFHSTICGQWCIFYIWRKCQGYSLSEITNKFHGKTKKENDKLVNLIVNEEFAGKNHQLLDKKFWISQVSQSMVKSSIFTQK
jgi:hypothetical protein